MKAAEPVVHRWEKWPFGLTYFPMSFVWLYYILRSKSVWFFTPSNPSITFGGMQGETKKEMYERLSPNLYPVTLHVEPETPFGLLVQQIEEAGIQWPFVVKPQIGEGGILFRKIDTLEQLREYSRKVKVAYIVQNLIPYPMEVSIFYYRMPNEERGTITGFLHKVPMYVVGDGHSTLQQLIDQHPKASTFLQEIIKAHESNLETVVPAEEKYALSHAANHSKGARFYSLDSQVNDRLTTLFDEISKQAGGWYYGRYDIMCRSVEDLKKGQHFSLLEYNGCGAEPNHIYDNGYTLGQAYREIAKHWAALYHISRYNAKQGIAPWPLWKGWRFIRAAKKLIREERRLDRELSF